jgi:YfiH family protein
VSGGLYSSLNVGFGSSDDPAAVAENRARCAAALGVAAPALVTVYQVHSPDVVTVDEPFPHSAAPRADALVTRHPGVMLGILTADCAPVLLADPEAGVIGAAHAGWKGARTGVLEAALDAMEALGARRRRITAAVGPHIGAASYEVGPEFPAPFLADGEDQARFFQAAARPGHFLFDLGGYIHARLSRAGVGTIEACGRDTLAESDRFFSYRRATLTGAPDYGRELSAIALLP